MSEPLVAATGVTKHFGPIVALRPLDLRIEAGEALALLGPNGAGKSTLLRLLSGLARPSGGRLQVAGSDDRRKSRSVVGVVAHESWLYPALTARENLVLAGRLHGLADPAARADALLAEDELAPVADRAAGALSRGLAQRVSIARARVHEPAMLLLDEPFSGLDPRAGEALAARLAGLRAAGRTLVFATHDLDRAAALADRALLLVRGFGEALPPEVARDRSVLEERYRRGLVAAAGGRA